MSDNEYDIYCPYMGGSNWKLNYLYSSCLVRQANGCNNKKCQHLRKNEKKEEKKRVLPVRACAKCGQVKKINGRNLCSRCYAFNYYNGSLDNYPKAKSKEST